MLKKEEIQAVPTLKDLSDEQVTSLLTLVQNNEDRTIGERIGKVYGDFDRDLEELGYKKEAGEKTYNAVKRIISELKASGDQTELNKKISSLEADKADLTSKLNAKGGEGTAKQIADLNKALADKDSLINDLKKQQKTANEEWQKKYESSVQENVGLREDHLFDSAISGFTFVDEGLVDKKVQQAFISSAKSSVRSSYKLDWIDSGKGDGKKVPVFRDENGEIVRNAENGLAPMTAKDLFAKELAPIIPKKEGKGGAGTKGGGAGGGDMTILDMTGVKTQVQADERIVKHLAAKGLVKGTEAFADAQLKIRTDNKVPDLPIRETT